MLSACATSTPTYSAPIAFSKLSLPAEGNLVLLGVSARLSTEENEIAAAKEVAARKVSMYHGLTASFEQVHIIGAGFFDFQNDTLSRVDYNQDLGKHIERLSFDPDVDFFRDSNGNVFIRFSYPATFPGSITYQFGKDPNSRPEWIRQPPDKINGFVAGLGRSPRLFRFADTFMRSREAAAIAIAARISTEIETEEAVVQNYQSAIQFHRQSIASMTHFLVLETWVDPQTRAVYTLAIAQSAN